MRSLLCIPIILLVGCFSPASSGDTDDGSTTDASSSGQASTSTVGSSDDNGPVLTTGSTTDSPGTSSTTEDPGTDSSGGEAPPMSSCDGSWQPWLATAFEDYPDGPVIGATARPSGPWSTQEGSPAIDSGQLTTVGDSVLVTSHGESFPFSGTRLRYSFSFGGGNNEVRVGFDANRDGDNGLSLQVRAEDGGIALLDNGTAIVADVLGALELDVEYFVEIEVDGGVARVWLSTEAFATVPGAEIVTSLEAIANGAPAGRFLAASLSDGGGGRPHVRAISIHRCNVIQPELDDVFFDSFNRPDSETVGFAVHPAGSEWNEYQNPENSDISTNRLRLERWKLGVRATVRESVGVDQTRLRAIVSMTAAGASVGVEWGIEGDPLLPSEPKLGCFIRDIDGAAAIELYGGNEQEVSIAATFAADTDYYIQVSIDGVAAAATVREASFTGPIVAAASSESTVAPLPTDNEVGANGGTTVGNYAYIDDLRLSRYPN